MDENAQAEHDGSSPTMEPIRFRAGKKRKAYRQRTADEEDKNPDAAAIQPAPVLPGASTKPGDADDELGRRDVDEDADPEPTTATATATTHTADVEMANGNGDDRDNQSESESAVLAALRLRNARRAARRGGVGFRAEGRPGLSGNDGEDGDGEHAMVLREQDKEHERIVGGITNRFMHQTGLLTILDDKHIIPPH